MNLQVDVEVRGLAGGNYHPGLFDDLVRATAESFRVGIEGIASFAGVRSEGARPLQYALQERQTQAVKIAAWAALYIPALLASAGVLCWRVWGPFDGVGGYLRACITVLVAILPGMVLSVWAMAFLAGFLVVLADHAHVAQIGSDARLVAAAMVSGALVFGYALIGGLIAAAFVYSLTWLPTRRRPMTFRQSYGTAFLALFAYGLLTALALYFFRGGDGLIRWVVDVTTSSELALHVRDALPSLWLAMKDFLPLQVPGLLAGGAILAVRIGRPFRGVIGYTMACAVAGAVSLTLALPVLGAGALAVKAGAIERLTR